MRDDASVRTDTSLALRECPFCGSKAVLKCDSFHHDFIVCDECDANGPTAMSVELAILGWNQRRRDALSAHSRQLEAVWQAGRTYGISVALPRPPNEILLEQRTTVDAAMTADIERIITGNADE